MKPSRSEIIKIVLVFLILFGAVQFSLQSFRVEGASMEPSFRNNQYLLVDKLRYRLGSPGRGDVIVFDSPQSSEGTPLIKRIIGLPGETVEIKEGNVYINGRELVETPDFRPIPYSGTSSVTVPPDHYYVLGDNRGNSTGSHIFGTVPRDNIVGRVWLYYWPLSDWGLTPEYSAEPQSIVTASYGQ